MFPFFVEINKIGRAVERQSISEISSILSTFWEKKNFFFFKEKKRKRNI